MQTCSVDGVSCVGLVKMDVFGTPSERKWVLVSMRFWVPLVGMTLSTFVFNTSEFMPIGLLTDIAADFNMTESAAGMLISVYAWAVMILSLPLMLCVTKVPPKRLLLGVIVLFGICQLLSAASVNFWMLMAARIGVAAAHAVFWSIVSPLAVRVAPKGAQSAALGLIITGTSIAMIVGLPLGRVIGLYVGWRTTFFFIAAVAAAVWLFLAAIFPRVPSRDTISLRKVPSLLGNPALVGVYVLTVLMVTGHYTGYSYIEPFLAQVAGLDNDWITWVLTAFGLVGIVGSLWFSRDYEKCPYAFMRFAVVGIAFFLLLLRLSAFGHFPVVALCICWGLAITIFNLVFQSEIIRLAPEATAIAMSVYSGIYNVGIGAGALVGGFVCTHASIARIGYAGGAIALLAALFCLVRLVPLLKRSRG